MKLTPLQSSSLAQDVYAWTMNEVSEVVSLSLQKIEVEIPRRIVVHSLSYVA